MIFEELRNLHEDTERLEQAIADRLLEDPKHIRDRLRRDHEIKSYLNRIQSQSRKALNIYKHSNEERTKEIQKISTGDPFDEFYKQYREIKDFHHRYPNEPVENLERAYKKRSPGEAELIQSEMDGMFTGEEGWGRFFDLTTLHEQYLNLPGIKGRRMLPYLQYLDTFDAFTAPQCPIKRPDKMTDAYFRYISALADYLESFMRRTRPLEDLDKLFTTFDQEFDKAWETDQVPEWTKNTVNSDTAGLATQGSGTGFWCTDCEKEFHNQNIYKSHLSGKKHIRAVQAKQKLTESANLDSHDNTVNGGTAGTLYRLKERAVADREFRVKKLASAMQTERSDTRVNVERRQGMTDRERQQELQALYTESEQHSQAKKDESDDEGEEKIYNPLKLPLAWDGKPIPFWLYKLHGLGVELPCEICGNFVYMGRRAFDKHFNEARHIYGLKCLGITNTTLFREITGIEDALKLWDKIQQDKKQEKSEMDNVVQMEDGEGNVMPEKVYYDLQKQGLL